ncbi:VQ motif-containing protein 31 [Neltuma alba]|uniref:VQ motif-containing protein 31 n=1 Tax=Neltuma alba TaxID=207710 RepID=UPI0010A400E1|nr:VQ motif-containing protein 31-like [Prosopis alba]
MKTEPLTTIVQTNTNSFRDVVQRLTSPSDCTTQSEAAKPAGTKKTASKLHERRQYTRPKLEIVKPSFYYKSGASPKNRSSFSPSKSRDSSCFPSSPISGNSNQIPSPKTPSTIFSRLTILEEEKKEELAIPELNLEEEEKAIKERRFYLHPSPRSKPGYTEPELLALFPLVSPNTSGAV